MLREGYNYIGVGHLFYLLLGGAADLFAPSSVGFLKKYLLLSFKRLDKVLHKMIISRGQRLFCAEAFLMSPLLGERGHIKNVINDVMGQPVMVKRTYYTLFVEEKIVFAFCS